MTPMKPYGAKPGWDADACNPHTQEAEAGGLNFVSKTVSKQKSNLVVEVKRWGWVGTDEPPECHMRLPGLATAV